VRQKSTARGTLGTLATVGKNLQDLLVPKVFVFGAGRNTEAVVRGTQAEYALIPSEMAMTYPVHMPACPCAISFLTAALRLSLAAWQIPVAMSG
jgi:hypothetical protein